MFLFPGIFLYDSSLTGAADHVAAFWAAPILLWLIRALRSPGPRSGVLLAVAMSGGLLTKYQGIYLVAFPALVIVAQAVYVLATGWGARRAHRNAVLLGAVTTALAGIVLTAPHWLSNLVWYGDPVYPNLHKYLQVHPWTRDSAFRYDLMF